MFDDDSEDSVSKANITTGRIVLVCLKPGNAVEANWTLANQRAPNPIYVSAIDFPSEMRQEWCSLYYRSRCVIRGIIRSL